MQVFVWDLPNNGRSLSDFESLDALDSFEPYGHEQCSTILWLSATVLATGNGDNSIIKLWYVTHTTQLLQAVTFINSEQSSDPSFFNHMDVQADTGLLILANSRQHALYTLHFQGNDDRLRFDYLADFSVSQPIMSFSIQYDPSDNPPALHLYCTQPMAIQNYTLNPALCRSSGSNSVPTLPDAPSAVASRPQHRSQPMTYATLLGMSPRKTVQSVPPVSLASEQPSPSPSSQLQPPSIRTTPQPPSPAGPSHQPRLLTPTHLIKQANRSASQSSMASLLSQHTPPSTACSVADNTDAVSIASTQGSKLQDGSVSRQQSAETIPSSAAALDASTSAQNDSPTASGSGSRADTPPPSTPALPAAAYLTPESYNPHRRPSEALQSTGSQPDLRLDLMNKPGTSDQVNVKLLRRDDRGAAAAGPSQQPPAPPPAAPSAVFSQPLDLLPVSNTAPSPQGPQRQAAPGTEGNHGEEGQGQAAASVGSSVGLLSRNTELSGAAVRAIADAVAERTLVQHKQLLSYLNDRHRDMLRVIKTDIREEGKRLQLAFDAQVSLSSTPLLLGNTVRRQAWCICMSLTHESHRI